ncbi:MAG: hypothetical protein R2794_13240 [Chitinophagales bacterium]
MSTAYYGSLFSTDDDQINVQDFTMHCICNNAELYFIAKDSSYVPNMRYDLHAEQQYHVLSDQGGNYTYQNIIAGGALCTLHKLETSRWP